MKDVALGDASRQIQHSAALHAVFIPQHALYIHTHLQRCFTMHIKGDSIITLQKNEDDML